MKLLLAACLLLQVFSKIAANGNIVFCYYSSWATYRNGDGKFDVENIDPNLCSHIAYAFMGVNTDGSIRVLDEYLELEDNWGRGNIAKFNNLKTVNRNLKTFASIGGWTEGSLVYSNIAADPQRRQNLVQSAVAFLQKYNFDGLDFDWEYPDQRDTNPDLNDKVNYITLLKELSDAFRPLGLMLTAAVGATSGLAEPSYNIPEVSKYLDLINLMTYDLHGSWETTTGINSPLYEQGPNNVDNAVSYWLQQGAPSQKLVLGVPLYGRTFTLQNPANNGVGAATTGPGQAGPITREAGYLGYNEICSNRDWNVQWDDARQVPYAYAGNQWVGFDNERSIQLKANYAKQRNLGGIMTWSIETDDFRGVCGTVFPLLRAINAALGNNVPNPQPPQTTTTTPRPDPGNPGNPGTGDCTQDGIFPDPTDCSRFIQCANGVGYTQSCPAPLLFDKTTLTCNYANLVEC